MPIYEYECKACGHKWDALQRMSDDDITECEKCKKPEAKKLISAGSFILKGSGFYQNDYKGK